MTKRIFSLAVVLLSAISAFGSTNPRSLAAQHQFHFQPAKGRSKSALTTHGLVGSKALHTGVRPVPGPVPAAHSARPTRPRKYANPPVSQIGFVSAAQIPAGGGIGNGAPALAGDFNGDGKKDVLTITVNSLGTYSLSVALSNGNGTFQAPVLTAAPGNAYDSFVVGDLNNDGIDDVVILHLPGTSSNFDVMLGSSNGTFTLKNNFVITSGSLAGGILYDSSGDGNLDLVAVDSGNPGSVWTLLGDGAGNFAAATSIVLPGQAGGNLIFGDFNGDGLLDFADNDFTSAQMTVYLALPSSQFATGVSSTTPDSVYDACGSTVGDLNGDGFPEIVSANCADGTITIYANNGDGTFQQGVYYDTANVPSGSASSVPYSVPTAVTIADVNGDGNADIIATNFYASDVTVLFGNGDATVQVPNFGYTTGGYPSTAAVVADFNGDGLLDILVADDIYSFSYMKGYGDGTFRAALDFYTPTTDNGEAYGWDIATGDFNGDGFTDVVVANCCGDATVGITVFLSRGDGSLLPGVNYGAGGNWSFVTVADFNKDGKMDIAALDYVAGQIQIYKGKGDGTFTAGTTGLTGDTNSQTLIAGDFNGDGYTDLAVANINLQNVGVFLNDKAGNLLAPTNLALTGPPSQVVTADVNGDGKAAILALEASCGCVAVLQGNGDGTFQPEADATVGNFAFRVATGDVNGDGKTDMVLTIDDFTNGHGIQVVLGNGYGTFGIPSAVYPSTLQANFFSNPYPSYLQLVDLDGDGNLDVVYNNTVYSTVGVMYGVGDGTLFDPVEYPTGDSAYGLALADVNNDGAVDVVTASYYTSGATVLLNNSGTATVPDYGVAPNPASATVTAGAAGTYTVTLTPRNFYNGTVTFTCGTLPNKTTCAFSNPTLTPNGNGLMTTTLTLQTTATVLGAMNAPAGFDQHRGGTTLLASLSGMGIFGLLLAGSWKVGGGKKDRRLGIILGALAVGMIVLLVGCGGNGYTPVVIPPPIPGTTPGTYTVTVTATGTAGNNNGSTAAHTFNVTLTVQ